MKHKRNKKIMPEKMFSPRPLWIGGLVAVVAAAAIAAGMLFLPHKAVGPEKPAVKTNPPVKVEKHDLPLTQVPDKFPAEFLSLEKGGKLSQNYNAAAADGQFQATRTYETSQTLAAEFKTYSDFFKKNGWTIRSTADGANLKTIIADKGNTQILVNISQNDVSKVKTVSVSAVTITPAKTSPAPTPAPAPVPPAPKSTN